MDGQEHLLSLKVMRISRPSLASAWQPFYSSSPSLSAHSTASILSLQGKKPLAGHPKTLRDLTHVSELLTLPAAFGSINLGETFQSCVCVNNETVVDVQSVSLKVEMQTATSKVTLAELGGPDLALAAGDSLENLVNHELKEQGQHVLACTVQYRLPANARIVPASTENVHDPTFASFRKFYKFVVTNPLSVKTRVHLPRSPSALLSLVEREKVFLEVHIQNLTQEPMWFEHMNFECVDGWQMDDANSVRGESIFSDSTAFMQPQDMRQYIYILSPTTPPPLPLRHTPGSIIPLGRLDITWRSLFGEPGRLLTSMLSRRIPLPTPLPPQAPVSAVPLHLQRHASGHSGGPSRERSPQLPPSRPVTPPVGPQRPDSPFRNRPTRPQSPGATQPAAAVPPLLAVPPDTPAPPALDVDLIITHFPRESVLGTPFSVSFQLTVSASLPAARGAHRTLSLVVQHLQPARINVELKSLPSARAIAEPSNVSAAGFAAVAASTTSGRLEKALPSLSIGEGPHHESPMHNEIPVLPPPFPVAEPSAPDATRVVGVTFLGASAVFLPPIRISHPETRQAEGEEEDVMRGQAAQDFELWYMPICAGFVAMGGLRVLIVEDKVEGDQGIAEHALDSQREVRTLREWSVIGEAWVKTS